MSEEKDKAIEKDQQSIQPTGGQTEELSEEDLNKASGGDKHKGWIELTS